MNQSAISGVPQMRLVHCEDMKQVYEQIIKPYAKEKVTYNKFKSTLDSLGKK